ncbi:hypothetical protein E2562_022790 [Oryza meyeriana var. granulata]|uniref:Uncharacterized protein n=1 Tax=Oryza meyeriana var. granulata TaxID=110450 RepID=A0A6G1EYE5_9ORYZ|nr:hypothetical protein E2562_022790 [Oryza meyeriana var. granulata]
MENSSPQLPTGESPPPASSHPPPPPLDASANLITALAAATRQLPPATRTDSSPHLPTRRRPRPFSLKLSWHRLHRGNDTALFVTPSSSSATSNSKGKGGKGKNSGGNGGGSGGNHSGGDRSGGGLKQQTPTPPLRPWVMMAPWAPTPWAALSRGLLPGGLLVDQVFLDRGPISRPSMPST